MANLAGPGGLPGAIPATLDFINEIVRGATIKAVRTQTAQDGEHGGECVMIELNGGDRIIFVARRVGDLEIDPDGFTARLQPLLVTKRGSRLKI